MTPAEYRREVNRRLREFFTWRDKDSYGNTEIDEIKANIEDDLDEELGLKETR